MWGGGCRDGAVALPVVDLADEFMGERLDGVEAGPPQGRGTVSTAQTVPSAMPVRSISGAPR